MKKVTSSPSLVTISHYRNLLTSEGIASFIRNEHLGSIVGEIPFEEVWPELSLRLRRALSIRRVPAHVIDDLIQETGLRLFRRWETVDHDTIWALTNTIALNLIRDEMRKRKSGDARTPILCGATFVPWTRPFCLVWNSSGSRKHCSSCRKRIDRSYLRSGVAGCVRYLRPLSRWPGCEHAADCAPLWRTCPPSSRSTGDSGERPPRSSRPSRTSWRSTRAWL